MEKHAVIITLYENDNYGNRLQNYAVTKVLEKRGFLVTTLALTRRHTVAGVLRDAAARIRLILNVVRNGEIKRYKRFRSFSKTYTPVKRAIRRIPLSMKNRIFVVGSDQVWNPSWGIGARDDGLQCAFGISPDAKIAISPSFGVDELSNEWMLRYSKWLEDFEAISVREEAGARIIEKLSGKRPPVLVDPTMILDVQEWSALSESNCQPSEKYILTYYLGDNQGRIRKLVHDFSENYSVEIIDLMDKSNRWHQSGPREFLALIKNAHYLVTDSFHGCVFALLFHTPFAVVARDQIGQVDMFSRIETLAEKFDLCDRIIDRNAACLPSCDMDWSAFEGILANERDKFEVFLEAGLKGK